MPDSIKKPTDVFLEVLLQIFAAVSHPVRNKWRHLSILCLPRLQICISLSFCRNLERHLPV